ncbi:MAG: hypothetical protein JNM22_18775 [Saprospiraceae bacterium]|nr:hypothetical protein [Saprospiraceae bacterium]
MKILLLSLLLTASFACRQSADLPVAAAAIQSTVTIPDVRYTQNDIRKLRWIEGAWESTQPGKPVRQSFHITDDFQLEINDISDQGEPASTMLSWYEGHFYLGENRDWVVTWIGEKDVRFDPVRPGKLPFTWTRFGENQWYHVSHHSEGDRPVLMQRTDEVQP